ncbi:hypothetical protein QFC19_006114 [Naganishia cerealis]|uniref:Uncharacterized protein n=1 Tax=Naganishia cerealis TaxID=610337 RepID=A0ACC2VJ05_9TREE|nr:hypothetical protein QFC19_006114 [Naganishia cerealis]
MEATEYTSLIVLKPNGPRRKRFFTRAVIALVMTIAIISTYLSYRSSLWNAVYTVRYPELNKPLRVRLYTHNIRFDNHNLDKHERYWSERKHLVTSSIDYNTDASFASVVCLQEVLHHQLQDILFNLNNKDTRDEWTYYGVGRSDGYTRGEYAPILYRTSDWDLVDNKTFWLLETPRIPSKGWDAALERIVTMVTLRSKLNPLVTLNFFNTHFDHRGKAARRHLAQLIANKMENYNNYPSFLCGDFNTQPTDEPYQILIKHGMKDSRALIDHLHHYGHTGTFTGFNKHNEANSVIDYVWAPYFAENGNDQPSMETTESINYYNWDFHKTHKIALRSFAILHSYYDFYMSDHRPVSADYDVSRTFF